jgi:hypothetical protein
MDYNKIDVFMCRSNGALRHAYLCVLNSVQTEMCYGFPAQSGSLLTVLSDIHGGIFELVERGSDATEHQTYNAIGQICDNVVELMHAHALDPDEMSDIISVFINECATNPAMMNTLTEEYIDEVSYWQHSQPEEIVFPVSAMVINNISHSTLTQTALADDAQFSAYMRSVDELSLWDQQWLNTYHLENGDTEHAVALQSWLMEMVRNNHLSVAEALSYAAEVTMVDTALLAHEQGDTLLSEIFMDRISSLTGTQQDVVAAVIAHAAHSARTEMIHVDELVSHIRDIPVADMPPAGVLFTMVSTPVSDPSVIKVRQDAMALEGVEKFFG